MTLNYDFCSSNHLSVSLDIKLYSNLSIYQHPSGETLKSIIAYFVSSLQALSYFYHASILLSNVGTLATLCT